MKKERCIWPVVNLGSLRGSEGRKRKRTVAKGPEVAKGGAFRARGAFPAYVE